MYKFILLIFLLCSCRQTYVVLGYEQPDDDSTSYVYLFKRTKFPKTYKYIYTHNPCSCIKNYDTIYFKKEDGFLVPIKVK